MIKESFSIDQEPTLIDMRQSIDHFDVSFLHLLAERVRVVGKIMHLKKREKIDPGQSEARREDMKNLIEMSVQLKLEPTFFKKILEMVFQDAMEQFNTGRLIGNPKALEEITARVRIEDLRDSLFSLDRTLCLVLSERLRVVKRIGHYKHELGIPPLDKKRWETVLETKSAVAQSLGISVPLIRDIYNAIHEVALTIERDIAEQAV